MAKVTDLRGVVPERNPKLDDVASWEDSFFSLGGKNFPKYNPDSLVGSKGLKIYERMRNDDQVKAVMQFKRDAITARGWSFVYDQRSTLSEVERKKRIGVFTEIFQKIQGGFEDALNAILTGRDFGFSMTEKVLTSIEVDKTEYVGIKMLFTRKPSTFEFQTDEYGVLQEVYQCVGGKRQELDMTRFIHYVHAPEFDRHFGRSDLREAYRPWYIKERIGDYWVLWLERFAGGFLMIKRPSDSVITPNSNEYTSLQEVLQNLHGASGVILPRGVEAELVMPTTTDAFEKAMVFWDLAIARSILVPNLLGLSHTGQTGAFAQSQTQMSAFIWTCKSDATRIQATIDDQLVKTIGDYNFSDGQYPSFRFNEMDMEFIKWLVEKWSTLVGKVVISTEADEAHFRKLLGMPERKEEDEPLQDPMQAEETQRAVDQQEFDNQMTVRQQDHAEQQAANAERFSRIERSLENISVLLTARDDGTSRVMPLPGRDPHSTVVPHGPLRTATFSQFSSAVMRVHFSVIEQRQETAAEQLTAQIATQIAKAVKRLLGDDQHLTELTDDNLEDVASIELSGAEKSRLQGTYKRALGETYSEGLATARNELERAAGNTFSNRRRSFASIRDKAASYFDVNSYRMAGNVSDATRAIIQQELQQSIKVGRSPEQTRQSIWLRLLEKGMTSFDAVKQNETDEAVMSALEDLGVGDEITAASYLDTLSRTNLFEAMNEARYAEFTDPELEGFVEALEYSAILDDRTTDICTNLDNSVYNADSDIWNEFRPPNHYNCRSLLIPITKIDGWDGQESQPPNVTPQAGFGAGTK